MMRHRCVSLRPPRYKRSASLQNWVQEDARGLGEATDVDLPSVHHAENTFIISLVRDTMWRDGVEAMGT